MPLKYGLFTSMVFLLDISRGWISALTKLLGSLMESGPWIASMLTPVLEDEITVLIRSQQPLYFTLINPHFKELFISFFSCVCISESTPTWQAAPLAWKLQLTGFEWLWKPNFWELEQATARKKGSSMCSRFLLPLNKDPIISSTCEKMTVPSVGARYDIE